jgi:integrase
MAVPANLWPVLKGYLEIVGPDQEAWLFPGDGDMPASEMRIKRVWRKACKAANRPDLHLHDLRHSGLTWAAAMGASTAELMKRAGHASPTAALRYQHATADRDRILADALASGSVTPIRRRSRTPSGEPLKNRVAPTGFEPVPPP